MHSLAPVDAKAIGASFSQLITATMVSRLVLNLRSTSTFSSEEDPTMATNFSIRFMINTTSNLGGELQMIQDDLREDEAIPMRMVKMAIAEVT
ncbi:hypothetical protein H0H81_004119 [Sphagnurus paluster]|uniref:Uncharacterized protein n=1 Tax=Sphagnurus paluster TaxID=117069 RepID=A0A9P7GL68_9AGAR|nr:hypothetical protein H0H81_004119 [Sphagnurus paluster]